MNHLETRIYSAIANHEDPIIDQVSNDIDIAVGSPNRKLNTDEYDIYVNPENKIIIKDKIHNELTEVIKTTDGFKLKAIETKRKIFK